MKHNNEVHLFIIWEKARDFEEEIIAKIENKFRIAQTYSITWSPYQVGNNFTRFYGANLPKNSEKEKHCGNGEFKLIVVVDEQPNYDDRHTSKGVRRVNVNMFDTKAILRDITGGGHKVHGTDSEEEAKHDLILLIGLSVKDFLKKHPIRSEDIIHKYDLLGCRGWDSFEQLFYVLNECSENIVLRNVENINLNYITHNKGDIDILAKNSEEIKYVLGDLSSIDKKNSHMHVSISKVEALIEVYQYGTNLYHKAFEDDLFKNKVKTNNIYHPEEEIEMYALIYHALLRKPEFEDKHKKRIFNKYTNYLGEQNKTEQNKTEQKLLKKIICYFDANSYIFIKPNIGYFNTRPEITTRLITNKNRDGFLKRNIKKILEIQHKRRELDVFILKNNNNIVFIKVKLFKGIVFCFYIGTK
ncbi:hypothetical protein ACPUVO_18885 [Pseudocolwellia sp. HL-MZ19]|uniref:hypothetical protein n=1 Tax=Pseudocolwellia sp. HL-MZ19 TaxID=3400846 RepID=UPI003CEB5DC6